MLRLNLALDFLYLSLRSPFHFSVCVCDLAESPVLIDGGYGGGGGMCNEKGKDGRERAIASTGI